MIDDSAIDLNFDSDPQILIFLFFNIKSALFKVNKLKNCSAHKKFLQIKAICLLNCYFKRNANFEHAESARFIESLILRHAKSVRFIVTINLST
jgi:hypothetical protein